MNYTQKSNANIPIGKRRLNMQTFAQSDTNSLNNGQNKFYTLILFQWSF